eukprot:11137_1
MSPFKYMLLAFVTATHITSSQTTWQPTSAPTPQHVLDTENGSMDCKNKVIDAKTEDTNGQENRIWNLVHTINTRNPAQWDMACIRTWIPAPVLGLSLFTTDGILE